MFAVEYDSEVAYVNMLLRSWPGLRWHVPEKLKKEEVALLFLIKKVRYLEIQIKGKDEVVPSLPHTQHTCVSCLNCRPRPRFQLRYDY